MKASPVSRLFMQSIGALDRAVGWHNLPTPLGLLALIGIRETLRHENMHDTSLPDVTPDAESPVLEPRYLSARSPDGTFNDLSDACMGSAGTRFGRNIPIDATYSESDSRILSPNPRTVSRALLTRDVFHPATTLNVWAAAWLQFMVHGWLTHGKNAKENPWSIEVAADDPWPGGCMEIQRTRRDPTAPDDSHSTPDTYVNVASHWWDGSQIYGSTEERLRRVRSGDGGKLIVGSDGLLPVDASTGIEITGEFGNWWLGRSVLHTLFVLEHNAICDRLRAEYPTWSDDELFDRARLVNAALMAKIHTVEWTPAVTAHPTLQRGMRATWWGLQGERTHRAFGRLSRNPTISGIPGSARDHHGVPFSMTEEFIAVYRMHPLIPDDFNFRSLRNDETLQERALPEIAFHHSRSALEEMSFSDILYSFGTLRPGAITLHNYPRHLQQLLKPDGTTHDLAATDIIRSRERGVPRYNEFRRFMHRRPVRTFEELTGNPVWVEELRSVYDGDIESVDLMIGLYAEDPPKGFAFSDTAFRIFTLMAPRRLSSDRFFTTDYTPRVYTQAGLDWIADNDMTSVTLRHFPALSPILRHVDNAFQPWPRANA